MALTTLGDEMDPASLHGHDRELTAERIGSEEDGTASWAMATADRSDAAARAG